MATHSLVSSDIEKEAGHNGKLDASENNDRNRACDKDLPRGMWMIRLPVRAKLQTHEERCKVFALFIPRQQITEK